MAESRPGLDKKVVEKLYSKKAPEREAARRELERLGPAAVDVLLGLLEEEDKNRRKRRAIGITVIVLWLVFLVTMAATHNSSQIGSFSGMISSIAALFAATTIQKNAARVLAEYDDIRGVGRLAEALEYDDKNVAKQAEEALTRLLPRLRATDHALLTSEQRRCLDRALLKHRSAALSLAILAAYEQVGDPTSVEVVEKIAAEQVRRVRDQAVVQRAQEVLPALRERAEMVRAAQTLLRPAESVGNDVLLRPASGPPSDADELLLRPVGEESVAPFPSTATSAHQQRLDNEAHTGS